MAKRLGELLIERGAITIGELHTGLEACRRSGGRLGTHLLRLKYVPEETLLEALAAQSGIPPVTEAQLRAAPAGAVRRIPLDVQRRLRAVPFASDERSVTVGMINPGDLPAIEELHRVAGVDVEVRIATEAAVEAVLQDALDPRAAERQRPEHRFGAVEVDVAADPFTRRATPQLLRRLGPLEPPPPRPSSVARFPELVELTDANAPGERTLDAETLRDRLAAVRHRDEAGALLLRFASRFLTRLFLLSVHRGRATGWIGEGEGLSVEDVQAISIALDRSPVLRRVVEGATVHVGEIEGDGGDAALAEALGEPRPIEVVMIPVSVRGRVLFVLVGDNPGYGAVGIPTEELTAAADEAGIAFEILILRNRLRGNVH